MEATPWARKRKIIYTSVAIGAILLVASIQLFRVLYEPPSCFDGKQNQGENGIDCGGSCLRICEEDVSPLRILQEQIFEIRDGVYTAAAVVENPNSGAGIRELPYRFDIHNDGGEVIDTVEGATFALPNSRFPIFAGPFELSRRGERAELSFPQELVWVETEEGGAGEAIEVQDTTLLSSETAPKLRAVLRNTTIRDIEDINVIALVSNASGEAVAASRTVVDWIPSEQDRSIVFTWPEAFERTKSTCEVPVGTMLAIDRSGSMNDDATNPPQPITDVLEAAESFVANLRENDRAGVVSFATNASEPIDLGLTGNKGRAEEVVSTIHIRPEDENSYTNIGDALRVAYEEISQDPSFNDEDREFVIVLLTDGEANYPQTPGGEPYALEHAAEAKRLGISIYTIGLGENVNREFLQEVATASNYYFEAATTDDLMGIYEEIGTSICTFGPAVIELFPRFNYVPELR